MRMNQMQFSLGGKGCKDHPNDNKVQGICSYCLREKLSQLHNYNNNHHFIDSSPSSPSSPTIEASSNHFALAHRRRLDRKASHATNYVSCMTSFNYELNFKKGKSIAFATRNMIREKDHVSKGRGRKKDGFWSKVIKLTRKDSKELSLHEFQD
ncbi:PREDICTED: uncharacterized protein LOC109327618 [Lupinus angustifolius]|uniref:uncharacterized protein LOC109327618 n=1 Tax=Lupinus angustifolius TaxID=3871 RepID=UPI00092E5E8D|nr:PREDICTED: uncharacterized protein LOC109327618 [Lupinus angustifolius]